MMEDEAVFSVLSKCFAPVERAEWEHIVQGAAWSDFLDGIRRLLQDEGALGMTSAPLTRVRKRCPLQEFLSAGEVNALFSPPTFEEKGMFAARHFTGGLPESVVPVESLYAVWSVNPRAETPFPQAKGLYCGDTARYMGALVDSLGLQVPHAFASYPDHVSLELDLVAVLLRSGMHDEACRFFVERFEWLTAYRTQLLALQDDARFYIGLVDVLLGIRAQVGTVKANV